MYNNYYQTAPAQNATFNRVPNGLKGRPVSSLDEARASLIDFDGTVFYFPDLANKCIYTKQINLDGTATLLMYELKEIPNVSQPNFVTREEFENTIAQLKNFIVPAKPSSQSSSKEEFNF